MSVERVTIGNATLYLGESLEVLQSLEPGSVDAVITDPPYSSGGLTRGDRVQDVKTKYLQNDSGNQSRLQGFTGDTRDQRGFHFWSALWSAAAMRATKPGGPACFFTDWRQLPVSTDYMQAGGWIWRGVVPWAKPAYRPQMGRFGAQCEYVVWGSNGPMPTDRGVGCLPGFFDAMSPQQREHVTQKPVPMMAEIVAIAPPRRAGAGLLHGVRFDRGSSHPDGSPLPRHRGRARALRQRLSPHRASRAAGRSGGPCRAGRAATGN